MSLRILPRMPRFGYADCEWPFDPELRPSLVAAGYRQHLLILAAREVTEPARLTATVGARRLATIRGGDDSEPSTAALKQVQRWLSGELMFTTADELEWRAAFGLVARAAEPASIRDPASYPPSFARLLHTTADGAVTFGTRKPLRWDVVIDAVGALVENDIAAIGAHVVTDAVVRRHLAHSLVNVGVQKNLVRPAGDGLRVLESDFGVVGVVVGLDDSDPTYGRIVTALVGPHAQDATVFVLGPTPRARLDVSLDGFREVVAGSDFTVPMSFYDKNDLEAPSLDPLFSIVATHAGAGSHLVLIRRKTSTRVRS